MSILPFKSAAVAVHIIHRRLESTSSMLDLARG